MQFNLLLGLIKIALLLRMDGFHRMRTKCARFICCEEKYNLGQIQTMLWSQLDKIAVFSVLVKFLAKSEAVLSVFINRILFCVGAFFLSQNGLIVDCTTTAFKPEQNYGVKLINRQF